MTTAGCNQIPFADLTDYVAGDLAEPAAARLEDHLFACAECGTHAAALERLIRAIGPAVRSADVGGFVTDEVLNRLAREGVRVRTFTLSPGAILPCAVWEQDELMALRLRADFGDASEVTLTQRIAGAEVVRASSELNAGSQDELIFTMPAAWVRELPVVEVEVQLTTNRNGEERAIGSYTLLHEGSLRRDGSP